MKNVKGYITRKSMLYKTGVEYGDYTMNHILGCAHGCLYPCYAFLQKKRYGAVDNYETWLEPYLVSNTLEILDKEIPRLKSKIKSVQLCFTTDPFMFDYDEIKDMTLKAIHKLNDAEIKCTVLTKGLLPVELAEFPKYNEYGITLISLDEKFREKIEPGAAKYIDRLNYLKYLHDVGCKTWVSVEPYPTPNIIDQDINELLRKISFVDKIIFGRTNYNKLVNSYPYAKEFYNLEARKVIEFCNTNHIAWYIKNGTLTAI